MLNATKQEQNPAGLLAAQGGSGFNRRRFLQVAGVTAGAATTLGLAGCGGLLGVDPEAGPAPSVEDVLNFALNLEYFEATFYLFVTTGAGLSSSDTGPDPGKVTGGKAVTFTDPNVEALAKELAADEQAHVKFIREVMISIGFTPVSLPTLNLAAMGFPTNDKTFLALARQLETTGTSAYEGAIQYLISSIPALNYAAVIHDAEGQHEAALRQFLVRKGIQSPAVDKFDRPPTLSADGIFNTSTITGLNTARNASEVLQIVYGAVGKTGVSSGGFFPDGFNGNVKTT